MFQRIFHAAEALNQFHRALVADTRRAGNVVDGIAAQRHHVDYFFRGNTENFFNLGGVANQIVLGRIEHADAVADQLHHVLIAGDDKYRVACVDGFASQRADHVVSLEARRFEHGNAIGLQRSPDVRNLLRQIVGHGRAIGLVAAVGRVNKCLRLGVELAKTGDGRCLLVAKRRSGHVKHCRQIFRRKVGAQLAQHVDEDKGRAGRNAGLGRHGPLPRHGVIGAKDERHGVDEVDAALGPGRLRR